MNREKNKKHILSDAYRGASDNVLNKLANAPSALRESKKDLPEAGKNFIQFLIIVFTICSCIIAPITVLLYNLLRVLISFLL